LCSGSVERRSAGSVGESALISDDVSRLLSLGPVTPGRHSIDLPAGVKVDEFPIVDVSVEQFDGNPAHSGDSIARGRLDV
jgi:hypothetical protein